MMVHLNVETTARGTLVGHKEEVEEEAAKNLN